MVGDEKVFYARLGVPVRNLYFGISLNNAVECVKIEELFWLLDFGVERLAHFDVKKRRVVGDTRMESRQKCWVNILQTDTELETIQTDWLRWRFSVNGVMLTNFGDLFAVLVVSARKRKWTPHRSRWRGAIDARRDTWTGCGSVLHWD